LRKRVPDFVAHRLTRKLACGFFEVPPEFIVTFVAPRKTDDNDIGWEFSVGSEVVQRRHKLAMSEITRGAENNHIAWLGDRTCGQSFAKRIWFGLIGRAVHALRRLRRFSQIE
jgi:hypothetical protein